MSNKHGLP